MAKKKTVVTTEEEVVPEETPIDYKRDLEGKTFEQVRTETPVIEEKVEEKAEEIPAEEETETIEFDPEQLKRDAVAQAKEELGDLLRGKDKEETTDNVDAYQEYQKEFFAKEKRQPTWFEVAHFMEGRAVDRLKQEQAADVKAQEEEKTQKSQDEKKQLDDTNKYVEDTLNELYTNEKLPRIQDKEDKDDYGIRVRNALLARVVEVNTDRITKQLPPKTIKEIFYEDFKIPVKEVAGAREPINMGRGGYTPDDNQELDYVRDIQGPRNSFRNILRRAAGGK